MYDSNGIVSGSPDLCVLSGSLANSIEQTIMRVARDSLDACFDKWRADYERLEPIVDWNKVREIVADAAQKSADGYYYEEKFELAFGSMDALVDFCMGRLKVEFELLNRTRQIRVEKRNKALAKYSESIESDRDTETPEKLEKSRDYLKVEQAKIVV